MEDCRVPYILIITLLVLYNQEQGLKFSVEDCRVPYVLIMTLLVSYNREQEQDPKICVEDCMVMWSNYDLLASYNQDHE